MTDMGRMLSALAVMVTCGVMSVGVNAQTGLAGQRFYNSDIMANVLPELKKQMEAARNRMVSDAEKKKGRKLTDAELKEISQNVKKSIPADRMINAMMTMSMEFDFISESKVHMTMEPQLKEDLLRQAKVGWARRQALKLMLKAIPRSARESYIRKGSMVIVSPGDEPDTLYLNQDGTGLSGKFESTRFTLIRK